MPFDHPQLKPAICELLLRNARVATMGGDSGYGMLECGALACAEGRIAWLGPDDSVPHSLASTARETIDCAGALLTPGLIDCHTHAVFAGTRAAEFEQRLEGASYEDIARAGGGIRATVTATRSASEAELHAQSLPRVRALVADGVTTVEIKSGYGLELGAERRMLRVARRLGVELGITVRTTFLGAHALPPEFAGRVDDYIADCCAVLRSLNDEGLVDAVDAFCENIGFTTAQTRRVFETARELGLPVKLHADQLSDTGGAALVAEFGGLSADHIEHTNVEGINAMARAGTVAVMLPGAYLCLRETRLPPIEDLRAAGVPMAVATDLNPGTSPLISLRLAMALSCAQFRLTPAESLRGATRNAARALGLEDAGTLRAGARCDVVLWRTREPAELSYWLGGDLVQTVVAGGKVVSGAWPRANPR